MTTKAPSLNVSPRLFARLAPSLVVATLIACCPLQTRADSVALSFTGGSNFFSTFDSTVGWAFTISSPVLVSQLGVWDLNNDGLNQSHGVDIWDSNTQTLLATATVPAGTSATLTDGFRYVPIVPVPLAPGSYTIADFNSSGPFASQDIFVANAATITTAPGVAYGGPKSAVGFVFPVGDAFQHQNSYFGPNFQFTTPVSTPDSGSTFGLLSVSLIALLGAARFRRFRLA